MENDFTWKKGKGGVGLEFREQISKRREARLLIVKMGPAKRCPFALEVTLSLCFSKNPS